VAAPDLSEAPEPSQVVGIVRWKSPQATLDMIYQWTAIRLSPSDLAAEAIDRSLADTLAFDAPVDAVVALDPRGGDRDGMPLAAVSVGVRSVEDARRAAQVLGTVTEVRPGEYKVNLRHGKRRSDRPFCLLSAATGPAPGRFVCGRRERDVDALRAYLTRTLPKRDLGTSDVHLEIHVPPILQTYGPTISQSLRLGAAYAPRKLEIGEPAFDRAIDRVAVGVSEELGAVAGDLDALTLDVSMTPEKATTDVAFRFKGQQSWTAATLATQATRAGAPPSMFWHLPASATRAGYQYSPEARRFEPIRRTLAELVDGWLLHEGISPADRAPLNALFSEKYVTDSPWVSASGPFTSSGPAKAPSKDSASGADPLARALDASGWHLIGVAAPNQVSDFVKNFALGMSRPKIQSFFKNKLATLSLGDDASQSAKRSPPTFAIKSVPVPKALPKGSADYEVTITRDFLGSAAQADGKKAAPKKLQLPLSPIKAHLLVVPGASETWLAFGSDRDKLVTTVLATATGAPEAATLASRQDLAPMKEGKFVSATYVTIESFLQSWVGLAAWGSFDQDVLKTMRDASSALNAAPHKGKTPMLLTSNVTSTDGLTWTMHLDIPKAVIEDVIILGASSAMQSIARP
jgi:hypothetical protein